MALRKNPKFDIKLHYKRTLSISFVLALFTLIAAFKFAPSFESVRKYSEPPPEVPESPYVPPTAEQMPPPPPKPPVPIEAPTDIDDFPDIEFDETDLDEKENISTTLMPPPTEDNEEEEPFPFRIFAEEPPVPIGGIAAIQEKISYPEIARRAGIQGTVFVKAYVDENGKVQKAEIVKGIKAGCDEEALRAVMETRFNPGRQRGKAVKVEVTVPIVFKLQ